MLRLTSNHLFDRQIAAVSWVSLIMIANGIEIFAGQCDCEKSVESGFLVIGGDRNTRCMLCGKSLLLTHIPLYHVEEQECRLVIAKGYESKSPASISNTSPANTLVA
jgi:hypothetical protein